MYELIALLVFTFTMLPRVPAPRECPPEPIVKNAVASADLVFSGEVVEEEFVDTDVDAGGRPNKGKRRVVKVKVEKWWKGGNAREVLLHTGFTKHPNGMLVVLSEDFNFQNGEKYLVYAYERDGKLRTNSCTRTRKLADAKDDMRELSEGREPDK